MSNELENHEDLLNLIRQGYSLSIVEDHLVVNDVPYLDANMALQRGRLAAKLRLVTPETLGAPENHQMYWSGSQPHYMDGTPIPQLGSGGPINLTLGETTYVRHLSNKPPEGFPSYTLLIEHYVSLLSAPAQSLHGATALTGAYYDVPDHISAYKVRDTFSARAEIIDLNRKLSAEKVAIIGLGGTGAFVLDFMVKTPVHSIDAYDFDVFEVHNCFRSPGEVVFDDFGQPKTSVYQRKYENFRHRLTFHNHRVTGEDDDRFDGITFAFVCIDDGPSREQICRMLLRLGIPFIDVGMGVEKESDELDGLLRTTLFTAASAERALSEVPFDSRDEMGAYRVFVQIAELNALNAAIAVIRYKQFRHFYADENSPYQNIISIGSSNWISES